MSDDPIIRVITKTLLAGIMLFALYVQFHGDYGPGGGFQAGVIFASAFILNAIVFGSPHGWARRLTLAAICGGVLLYGGVGVAAMGGGGNFLDYFALAENPQAAQHLGILLVELGVGITVASVMVALFFTFAERTTHKKRRGKRTDKND